MATFQLKTLSIIKFLTIQETVIDFDSLDFPLLILGMNLDLQRSNGAGKTTFLNAISYLQFGETITEVPADFYDGVEISGTFKDIETGEELSIERSRNGGKTALSAELSTIGKLEGNTTSQVQTQINKLFGIKEDTPKSVYFNDYVSTTYLSGATVDTFASDKYTPQERMDMICRMLDLEIWDRGIANAKDMKKDISGEITILENNIKYIESNFCNLNVDDTTKNINNLKEKAENLTETIKIQNGMLESIQERWNKYNEIKIKIDAIDVQIMQLRRGYQQQVATIEQGITNSNSAIEEAKVWLKSIGEIDIEAVKETFVNNNNTIIQLQEDKANLNLQLGELQSEEKNTKRAIYGIDSQINQAKVCPGCNAELLINNSGELSLFNLSDAQVEKNKLVNSCNVLSEKITQVNHEIANTLKLLNDLNQEQTELRKKQDTYNLIQKKEELIKVNLDRIKTEQINIEQAEINHSDSLQQLYTEKEKLNVSLSQIAIASTWKDDLRKIKEEITEYQSQLNQTIQDKLYLEDKIKDYQVNTQKLKSEKVNLQYKKEQLSNYVFWIEGFAVIKRNIVDSFIPILEGYTNENIKTAGMDFTVSLNTVKETKAGEIRQKFNITVLDAQGLERPVNSYSAGERKTLAICLALAIRDYKTGMGNMPYGFIKFDEVADSLDEVGQKLFATLLKDRKEQCLVISHSDYMQNLFPGSITIVKQNGISTIG